MLIQRYRKSWGDDFSSISAVIYEFLYGVGISIEHIGSTAVPGLAAKPIIDIDIVHVRSEEFQNVKKGLAEAGYYHAGDQGINGREVFKRREGGLHPILDTIKHHLYVCQENSAELKRHILFRDYLIANSDARKAYQHLKEQIAKEANQDLKKYAELKELRARSFIDQIICQ